MRIFKNQGGFTLMEVMIAVGLSTLLLSGIVQLLTGSVAAYRLQLSQSQLEESARYAREVLFSHITQAGYQTEPWQNQVEFPALTGETRDGSSISGDELGLQRWSAHNCYGNENSVTNSDGQPEFFLLQTRFHINTSNNLAITCRYGPDASRLQTQINNFGLVENVESMQILFAEDRNGDDIADTWVQAQTWLNERNIRAVKVALLLSTQQAFDRSVSRQITLLDKTITTPPDGHLRRVSLSTSAIRGRLR
jgi:prepilin-type N-terminal cleavage/methylation domain-containing protein